MQEMDDLRELMEMRAEVIAEGDARLKRIDEMIERHKAEVAGLAPEERRRWIRDINRTAIWLGLLGAAHVLREAARRTPSGAATLAAGAVVAVPLVRGDSSQMEQSPPPSVSIPAVRPPSPPAVQRPSAAPTGPGRSKPRPARPRRPPQIIVLPTPTVPPPAVESILEAAGHPKAPPPMNGRTTDLSTPEPPAVSQTASAVCAADLRLGRVRIRLLCRR